MVDGTVDVVVVGGSIAALVAADALATAGRTVRLVLPARGVGGGFVPVTAGGRLLDLGPRFVELAYDDEVTAPPPLDDYRPGPHGHRPYLRLIADVVRGLGSEVVDIRPPELVRRGRRVADFLLLGDLVTLAEVLDETELAAVAVESAAAVDRLGPAGWLALGGEDALWHDSLAVASVGHHGPTFHDAFIESVAGKVVAGGSGAVVAALRRKIWLPLFHPSTLHDAVTGSLRYRPRRPAQTIEPGGMGSLVTGLLDRIRAAGAEVVIGGPVRAVEHDSSGATLTFDVGSITKARQVVLGGPAEEVFAAVGVAAALPRCRCVLAWVDVPAGAAEAPSSLFAVDPDVDAYRVSESTAEPMPGLITLTCELRHDTLVDDAGAAAVRSLVQLGLLDDERRAAVVHVAAVPAFTEPSFAAMAAFAEARAAFDARSGPVHVVGPASGFAADSFNEQVVQGLQAAARLV